MTEFPLSPADTAELCDALVEHVVVFDAEGRIAWANQAAAASAGLAPAALIGHPCPVHCRAEHAGRTQCVVQSVLESGEPHEASLFASERAWHVRSYPLRGPDGRVSGAVGLRLEITDRHKALRQSEARYRTLVDTCPDAILLIDLTGRPLMANQRAAELCGYATTEQLLAQVKNALDLSPSDDRERAAARLREILQSGPTRSAEYDMVSRDGTRIPVEVNASVLRDEDEQAHAVMTVIRDARDRKQAETERRQLEAEVRHAQKLESLGVLAGGIAHDFNNLLTSVMGHASLAALRLPAESPAAESVAQIHQSALRAAELANQMLTYAGKGELALRPLDLSELVRETAALIALSKPSRGRFAYELAASLPPVLADPAQLTQLVMNLVSNAAEAIAEQAGVVSIRTGEVDADASTLSQTVLGSQLPPGHYVFLEVGDTGSGMDEATREKIFDPFFTTKLSGRGLGLATVLGIVRGHRGTIGVSSRAGEGTVFKVLLPVSDQPLATQADRTSEYPLPHGSGTVLLVDDEAPIREVASEMLQVLGFDALRASDGAEAIAKFNAQPDLICAAIVDVTMPGLNGVDTLAELRRLRPELPAILSTGYDEQAAASDLTGAQPVGFLKKPYTLGGLAAQLRRVLPLPDESSMTE